VIKGAFPQLRIQPMFGEDLDERGRKRVIGMLRTRPNDYVAQELVHLSQAPVWDRAQPRLLARSIGLRVFACATPNGYYVMPGGLTRVAGAADQRVISMQRGGSSKDTWVLTTGPVSSFSLLRRSVGTQDLVRAGTNLSSRVVENLFWFGRYCERCEGLARLLRVALGRFGDNVPGDDDERARPVMLELLHRAGVLTAAAADPGEKEMSAALRAAITDDTQPGLASGVRQLMRVAANLRERLSLDNWRTLNHLAQGLTQRRGRRAFSDLLGDLDLAIASFTTLSGYALDGMTRDPGWRFLSVGRRLERLQWMCTTLKLTVAGPPDMDLTWLLRLADSIITYRARYMARPEWLPVLDLLIRDSANPRSIAFQVNGLFDYVQRLVDLFGEFGDERFGDALATLAGIDPGPDLQPGSYQLGMLLESWHGASFRLAEQLGQRFFAHVGEASRQTFAT
jgi:uncharacterized alpha-E superfamily protein